MGSSATDDLYPHAVTVVQSALPKEDAGTLVKLMPNLFTLEESTDVSTTVRSSTVLLIFVLSSENSGVMTPLLASEEQIQAAIRANHVSIQWCHTTQVSLPDGQTLSLCSIGLEGGTHFLMTPPALTSSVKGREILALALTSTDGILRLGEEENGFVEVPVAEETLLVEELPKFPTLATACLEQHGVIQPDFPLNSHYGVPVETDLFVGRILMVLRPIHPEDDPYWNERLFSKRKRRLVCQIQGKFKRVPNGELYAGGEISDKMRLGLVAKGICGLILKLVTSVAPETHYSFGDSKDNEKPHIVVPAWSFFERMVVTKPDQEAPVLGEEFVESEESVAARKSFKSKPEWNTRDTYSMSFYTMYMDLAKWQIVQLPLTGDIDLKTFWGNSFLRIVLYENTTPPKDGRHLQKDNNYYFVVELKHLDVAPTDVEEDEAQEAETPLPWERPRSTSLVRSLEETGRQESGAFLLESAGDEDYFFDAEEENSLHELDDESVVVTESTSGSTKSMDLLLTIDSVCPTMIEMYDKGRYAKVYAFNLQKKGKTVFRTAASVEENFATSSAKQIADDTWSPRLSSSEKHRRVFGYTLTQALLDETPRGVARLNEFAQRDTIFDRDFLRRSQPSWVAKRKERIRKCGFGARALSEHHWQEEFIQITDRFILFHHPDKHKAHFRVSLQSIVEVESLASDDVPLMPSFSFMAIGTLGRTIYVMFPPGEQCNDWVDLITGLAAIQSATDQRASLDSASISSDHSMAFDNPADEFLQDSSLFNCKQRRILNGRKFSFRAGKDQANDPTSVVENALVNAFDQADEYDEQSMIVFLDSASALKDVDARRLGEKERLTFFLNLYHVMIMHAFLVLGPPDSTFKSISYFNTIAYQCSDDIFSLTELEHCIIRAAMSYPAQFVSKFVLPKSRYEFALTQADYRINFAFNCGSVSNPPVVPIYRSNTLDRQLDSAARRYLAYSADVRASSRHVTLVLPKVCQWFAEDFGNGSTTDVVRSIERYLNDNQRTLVAACFSESEQRYKSSDLHVKHSSFSFECRTLKLDLNW